MNLVEGKTVYFVSKLTSLFRRVTDYFSTLSCPFCNEQFTSTQGQSLHVKKYALFITYYYLLLRCSVRQVYCVICKNHYNHSEYHFLSQEHARNVQIEENKTNQIDNMDCDSDVSQEVYYLPDEVNQETFAEPSNDSASDVVILNDNADLFPSLSPTDTYLKMLQEKRGAEYVQKFIHDINLFKKKGLSLSDLPSRVMYTVDHKVCLCRPTE